MVGIVNRSPSCFSSLVYIAGLPVKRVTPISQQSKEVGQNPESWPRLHKGTQHRGIDLPHERPYCRYLPTLTFQNVWRGLSAPDDLRSLRIPPGRVEWSSIHRWSAPFIGHSGDHLSLMLVELIRAGRSTTPKATQVASPCPPGMHCTVGRVIPGVCCVCSMP